eukprot:3481009-Amphidinium_carterae.1
MEHTIVDDKKTCTFEGFFEELLLPCLSDRSLQSRTPYREFLDKGKSLLRGYLPLGAEVTTEATYPPAPSDLLPCGVPFKQNPLFVGIALSLRGLSWSRRMRRL